MGFVYEVRSGAVRGGGGVGWGSDYRMKKVEMRPWHVGRESVGEPHLQSLLTSSPWLPFPRSGGHLEVAHAC